MNILPYLLHKRKLYVKQTFQISVILDLLLLLKMNVAIVPVFSS